MKIKLFKYYCFISAIFPLEAFISPVIVIFYMNYVGISFLQYSNFMSILLILNMIFEIPMGLVSDLMGRRHALIMGNFIYASALLSILWVDSIWYLVPIAFLLSVGQSLGSGNLASIGHDAFSEDERTREEFAEFLSKVGSLSVAFAAIAALLGGWLAEKDLSFPMIADAMLIYLKVISGVIFFIFLWPVKKDIDHCKNVKLKTRKILKEEIVSAFKILKSKKFIWPYRWERYVFTC